MRQFSWCIYSICSAWDSDFIKMVYNKRKKIRTSRSHTMITEKKPEPCREYNVVIVSMSGL